MRPVASLFIAALFPLLLAADSPTSQPATAPIVDDSTPAGFLHWAGQILPKGGIPAALSLVADNDDREKAINQTLSQYTFAISELEAIVHEKWGQQADDDFVHALGEKTDTDVDQAQIETHDDHAVVVFKGDEADPLPLIRIEGHWKVDLTTELKHLQQINSPPEAWMKYCADVTALVQKLKTDLAAGKFPAAAELCKEATLGITRLSSGPM